ncbi:MAG: recombinase family protein, partial [Ilyomonas sp.]
QADKGYSLRDQKDRLEKYCALKGISILAHYQDDHSAKTFDRPEFTKLLDFAKKNKHQIDNLIVVKWDRFSRNATDALNMLRTFHKLGISVDAAEQPIDLSIPENKLMLSFYLTAPEVENDRRAMNTANGMRRAKLEGRWVAGAPFGYKFSRDETNKPLLVKNEKAALVKEAFEMYATGVYDKEEVRKKLTKKGMNLSRSAFWNMLHNVIYCGLIKVEADKSEPETIVKGVHEAIISEDVFDQVQLVASGKKLVKAKPKKVTETLPMRGYLVCKCCGMNMTGSASKGNGGKYFYYHGQPGCKERHKADIVHDSFSSWLDSLSIEPAIAQLYLAVMQDIFKTEEGDRDKEVGRIDREINEKEQNLIKAAEKLVSEDLDKWSFKVLRENLSKQIVELKRQRQELLDTDDAFGKYMKYGMSLLTNLKGYYDGASLEGKQKFLGSIFPEKLIIEDGKYRTTEPSDFLSLICSIDKGFSSLEKEKGGISAHPSRKVARTRIELVSKV